MSAYHQNRHFQHHQTSIGPGGHAQPVPAKAGWSSFRNELEQDIQDTRVALNCTRREAIFYEASWRGARPEVVGEVAEASEEDLYARAQEILTDPREEATSLDEAFQEIQDQHVLPEPEDV
jgi:hypothetical protein